MFHSRILNLLAKLWNKSNDYCKQSFTNTVSTKISTLIDFLLKGSFVVKIIKDDKSWVENSLLYKIYCKIVDFTNWSFRSIRATVTKYKHESALYMMTSYLFRDEGKIISSIITFLITFSAITLILNIFRNNMVNSMNVMLLVIVVLSIILGNIKMIFSNILQGSFFWRLIKDIFTLDNGGEQWW